MADKVLDSEDVKKQNKYFGSMIPKPKDIPVACGVIAVTTFISIILYNLGFTDSNIIPVYILGILLISLFTWGNFFGILGSLVSVMLFNFLFTEPRFTFHAYDSRYTVTFAIMLTVSIITGTLATKLKSHARTSAQAAFRTKVLLDTNQLLQQAKDDEDIFNITATQLVKLLNKTVVMYAANDSKLSKGSCFLVESEGLSEQFFTTIETQAAKWAYDNKRRSGNTTNIVSQAKCLYMAICINENVYGVVGIHINGKPLEAFEDNMLLSILGECALALDNNRNAREKEMAALMAKNEQLRANLLRAISHDLRTPLTSISGNAGNLISNYDRLDEDTKEQIFTDIFDDSQWLISLVENLLSITRIEEDRMIFNMSVQLMDEVIDEALKHVNRKASEHVITVDCRDELLLASMDAKLIIQVIINLVDNAVKYTQVGSKINIIAENLEGFVSVSVSDDGKGIPDDLKGRVFEMFFTGDNKIGDSRRSLGLGLPLCKSIINAHGGELTLKDNNPHGCVFTFTVPSGEVDINE